MGTNYSLARGGLALQKAAAKLEIEADNMTEKAKDMEKEAKKQRQEIAKYVKEGDMELARISAEGFSVLKTSIRDLRKASVRSKAMAAKITAHGNSLGVTASLDKLVTKTIGVTLASNPMAIHKSVEDLDKTFEMLEASMESVKGVMDQTQTSAQNENEIVDILREVGDECGIDLSHALPAAPEGIPGAKASDAAAASAKAKSKTRVGPDGAMIAFNTEDDVDHDLEKRLSALKGLPPPHGGEGM